MNELALFAGAGGGILGGHLLGWRTVCAVEWEPYPASVLCARQNDGFLPPFPIWDDIQTFDGRPWRGIVDVVSGGFPCQDISAAGKGAGIEGDRSGMWKEMARVVYEVRPQFVFVENSPMLTSRGLGTVLGDLASMGFNARWGVLGAADVGANHQRDRIWIVGKLADTKKLFGNGSNDNARIGMERKKESESRNDSWKKDVAFSKSKGSQGRNNERHSKQRQSRLGEGGWSVQGNWSIEPNVGRVANGVASRVDRLKAIGNGQVPEVARRAWEALNDT
jgi:DNA (cytosine-5)-methyltransferase 1